MKKIWLIAFLFNCFTVTVWCESLLSQNTSLNFYADLDKDFTYGTKIKLPGLDFSLFKKQENISAALGFSTAPVTPKFPFTIKFGRLSYGGAFSRLSSPGFSSSFSPFSSGFTNLYPFTCNVPSPPSFSKDYSLFYQLKTTFNNSLFSGFTINSLVQKYKSTALEKYYGALSIQTNVISSTDFKVDLLLSGGLFPHIQYKNDSWFISQNFYNEDFHLCSTGGLSLKYKGWSSNFSLNGYENPFGKINFTFRNENQLKVNKTIFSFSEFYNGTENLLTVDNKNIKQGFQAKISLQNQSTRKFFIPFFVKSGFAFYGDFDLYNKEHKFDFCFGTKATTAFYSGSFVFNTNTAFIPVLKNFSIKTFDFKFYNTLNFEYLNLKLNISANFIPSEVKEKQASSQKISLVLCFPKNPYININSSVTFNQKNFTNTKTQFTFGGNISYKASVFNIKFSVKFVP